MKVVQITGHELAPHELFSRLAHAATSAAPGRFAVQLRSPELDGRALYELGRELRRRTRDAGCALWVNDRIDLAMVLEADGVHLGRHSIDVADARALLGAFRPPGNQVWVSVSAHDLDDVAAAAEHGASAVVLAPIFASPGKAAPLGPGILGEARRRLPSGVSLIALGGIDADNAEICFAAGADGVAAIRADLTPLLYL